MRMQLTFLPFANAGFPAPDSAARSRSKSVMPKPSMPPRPICKKSRRVWPAQFVVIRLILCWTLMIKHKFGRVEQRPKHVFRGGLARGAVGFVSGARDGEFALIRRAAKCRQIQRAHNLLRAEFAVHQLSYSSIGPGEFFLKRLG